MKRYFSILLCLLCLTLLLCVPVSAGTSPCHISDDMQTLHYNGKTYTRVNTLVLEFTDVYQGITLALSDEQSQQYSAGEAYTNDEKSVVDIHLLTPDGTQVIMGYLLDSLVPEYRQALTDQHSGRILGYFWNDVSAYPKDLKGTPVTLDASTARWSESYPVLLPLDGCNLSVIRGTLLVNGKNYYYVDHDENNIVNRTNYINQLPGKEIQAYKITDTTLCESIAKARASERTLGFDDGGTLVTGILMTLIFGLMPCAVLVIALIFSFRSKDIFYRRAWRITAAITGAELIVFVTVLLIILRA